jgi:hypothetical protein
MTEDKKLFVKVCGTCGSRAVGLFEEGRGVDLDAKLQRRHAGHSIRTGEQFVGFAGVGITPETRKMVADAGGALDYSDIMIGR